MKPNSNGIPHDRLHGKSRYHGNYRTDLLCDHASQFLGVGENMNIGIGDGFRPSYEQQLNGKIPNSNHHIYNGERGDFWLERGNKSNELDEVMFMVDNFQKVR